MKNETEVETEELVYCTLCDQYVVWCCEDTDFCEYYDHPE